MNFNPQKDLVNGDSVQVDPSEFFNQPDENDFGGTIEPISTTAVPAGFTEHNDSAINNIEEHATDVQDIHKVDSVTNVPHSPDEHKDAKSSTDAVNEVSLGAMDNHDEFVDGKRDAPGQDKQSCSSSNDNELDDSCEFV